MGEAKRRKQLDPTYGKTPRPVKDLVTVVSPQPQADRTIGEANIRKRIQALRQELLEMSLSCKESSLSPDRCVFLGDNQPRVRQIGEELNRIDSGRTDLMVQVALSLPEYDQRELDYAWNDIGDWKA